MKWLRSHWEGAGGARDVLVISYPLVLSHMSFTIQTFVDRVFLTWYSTEAVAGAVTALFTTWVAMGVFLGTGEYLTTFVAQYFGARRFDRIGHVMWQGIYFSFFAGVCVASSIPLFRPLFSLGGHTPLVQAYEITYASILALGAFPVVLMATLATFFAGRGQTLVVLGVNLLVTIANVILDYLLIFGHGGFPRWGVAGAALATVTSEAIGAIVFFALMMRPIFWDSCATLSAWRFDWPLFRRLLRYGLPTGLQYTVEILAFAIFMILVGRIGTDPLAATGITFNLNMIVFMPLVGMGVGVSSLVGRYLGEERPGVAERSASTAFWIAFAYMGLCGLAYVLAPHVLLSPYAAGADPNTFPSIEAIAVVLLRFVAVYSIFDTMNIIFAFALRGAGDTVYPLTTSVILSWCAMLVPTYVACNVLGGGVYMAWCMASAYVILLGLLMIHRFRKGAWKSLRVIEQPGTELNSPQGDAEWV